MSHKNSISAKIYRALAEGPKTNKQLQDEICEAGATISAVAAGMQKSGYITRIDGKKGRGFPALYKRL